MKDLPYREKIIKKTRYYNKYYCKDGLSFYKRLGFLLNNNIGKPFDTTFSYFCRNFPKELQPYFLELFSGKRLSKWYVDEEKNIQKIKPIPKKYYILNPNSKVVYRNIYTGQITFDKTKTYLFNQKHWVKELTEPAYLETNKKSSEFKEYIKNKNLEIKKINRLRKKENKTISQKIFNEAMSKNKELLRLEKELDILKRDKHGFDDNSFIGEPYHGRKNKSRE